MDYAEFPSSPSDRQQNVDAMLGVSSQDFCHLSHMCSLFILLKSCIWAWDISAKCRGHVNISGFPWLSHPSDQWSQSMKTTLLSLNLSAVAHKQLFSGTGMNMPCCYSVTECGWWKQRPVIQPPKKPTTHVLKCLDFVLVLRKQRPKPPKLTINFLSTVSTLPK